jgi:hypothetical protein
MLDELDRVLGTAEFENDGFLLVTAAERDGDRLTIGLLVHPGEAGDPETWGIACERVEAFALHSGPAHSADVSDDDPALWVYTEPSASLYCAGVPEGAADAVLGALYYAHAAAVGEAAEEVPFGRELNAQQALAGGSGLVALGPLPLLRAYEAALVAHGITTSIIGPQAPRRWDGSSWVERSERPRLLTVGASWVVAASFRAARTV